MADPSPEMSRTPNRDTTQSPRRSPADRALAASGAAFVVLFVGGLFFADLVATTTFPTPTSALDEVVAYFTDNGGAVRALATFHAFGALALLVFAGYVSAVLRVASPSDRGLTATLAATGGAVAAGFLLLDAALFWVLALPSTTTSDGSLQAVHGLSYMAGGVAFALPLAVLIGATSMAAAGSDLFPRWVVWLGGAATAEALVYGATLTGERGAWSPSGVLVVFAALPLLWVAIVSVLLATPRRGATEPSPAFRP